jgi:hypothetical protein
MVPYLCVAANLLEAPTGDNTMMAISYKANKRTHIVPGRGWVAE